MTFINLLRGKTNSTHFHSLMFGDDSTKIPDVFDNAWTYDGSKESALKIIEDLKKSDSKH